MEVWLSFQWVPTPGAAIASNRTMPSRAKVNRHGVPAGKKTRRSKSSDGPTIIDVAKAAGVSTATVSRVLGNSNEVSSKTRESVLDVIASLGYSPNAAAKSLRTLQTHKLLVIVPDISQPFFSTTLQGIEEAALKEGYAVLVGDTQNQLERDTHYASMLPRKEVDGLIVLSQKVPTVIRPWMKSLPDMAPVVTGFIAGSEFGVSSTSIDNEAAGTEAADHLYGLGHRRIGVIAGPLELPQVAERIRGVKVVARRYKALKDLSIESTKFSIDGGIAAGTKLLSQPNRVSAILCFSDDFALGVMVAARALGIPIPAELSVVGFDDLPVSAHLVPPLTTVALPMRDAGREAVRLLVGRLRGHIAKPLHITLPFRLVYRGSTAPPGSAS